MTGTFIDEPIEAAGARAEGAAEGKNVGILGATVTRLCLERGLLDEVVVHLAPALLGDGVRLLALPGARRVELEPTRRAFGPGDRLRFRVGGRGVTKGRSDTYERP